MWRVVVIAVVGGLFAPSADAQVAGGEQVPKTSFLHDVARDYRNFFSEDTVRWLGVGGATAFAVHAGDEILRSSVEGSESPGVELLTAKPSTVAGQTYGNTPFQVPFAITWWIVGNAVDSARGAAAGRDLLRAQISAMSWTYAVKYAVDRTRPNGDPRSFPSGHTSSAFATAVVLQQHYGYKLGIPTFAAAVYTSASRVVDNKHWASDVVFGAFLGMVSARAVTVRLRTTKVTVSPIAQRGTAGVLVIASRSH